MSREIGELKAELARFSKARDWERFHTPKNLAMAMSVEAAEVVEIFQWLTEAQARSLDGRKKAHLADELADTYIYLLRLAECFGIDLVLAAKRKIKKSARKYPVARSRGLAKKYTELRK